MPETDIGKTDISDLATQVAPYVVDTTSTDAAAEQEETTYTNSKWAQYLGYYKEIPELTASIDAKATWTIGKGFTADEVTSMILGAIKGWGKDTFNTILENGLSVELGAIVKGRISTAPFGM